MSSFTLQDQPVVKKRRKRRNYAGMDPDAREKARKIARKESNRRAAQRSRDRKRDHTERLTQRVNQLGAENLRLKRLVAHLSEKMTKCETLVAENADLRRRLDLGPTLTPGASMPLLSQREDIVMRDPEDRTPKVEESRMTTCFLNEPAVGKYDVDVPSRPLLCSSLPAHSSVLRFSDQFRPDDPAFSESDHSVSDSSEECVTADQILEEFNQFERNCQESTNSQPLLPSQLQEIACNWDFEAATLPCTEANGFLTPAPLVPVLC